MTGEEAITYMENVPWQGTRLGLERTQELLALLGNPEKKLKFVHIAGTNGKGSTACMTASVLRSAGYRTGLYISPFLQVFNERMSVNGENISGEQLGAITEQVKAAVETMEEMPTEFEMMTVVAFLYFLEQKCDIVVLEVGMGGRLDSTNVIPVPEAAVICNIGLDHVKELGDTLEKIAFEKAGIIKEGGDVVLYEPYCEGVLQVVQDVCRERKATLHTADFSQIRFLSGSIRGQEFSYRSRENLKIRLLGEHQLKNAAVVLEVVDVLKKKGYDILEEAVRNGLSSAVWPGRFEVLHEEPLFIADGGHNRQCVESVAAALSQYFPGRKITFIMGILADKDYHSMVEILAPFGKKFYTVTPNSPRALTAEQLSECLKPFGQPVIICESAADAVEKAFTDASSDDIICSVGSLYMTGAIRTAVLSR